MTTLSHFDRGFVHGLRNLPRAYGCHVGMRSTLEEDKAEYERGYHAGQIERGKQQTK